MKFHSAHEAVKAAPPISVGGLSLFGVPLNEWVLLLTVVYTMFLIIDKFPSVVLRLTALHKWARSKNEQGNRE